MTKPWATAFRYWILTVVTIVFVALFWYARELISVLLIGALLAFVLDPAVVYLSQRTRLRKKMVVTIVFFAGLAAMIGLPSLMLPRLIDEIKLLFADLQNIVTELDIILSQPVVFFQWELDFAYLLPDIAKLLSEGLTAIPQNALHILEATTKNLIWALVILVTTYYLLRDWHQLRNAIFVLVPEAYRIDAHHLYDEIRQVWQGYLRGNLLLMLIVGITFTLAWLVIGLPGALILGLITGLLTIIPDIGPAIAVGIAILVALFEGSTYLNISNFWFATLVFGIYLVLINVKGLWLRPLIFARSMHMHDGVVFIAIMAAVILQGILGALIVIPVLASAAIFGKYIYLQFFDLKTLPKLEEDAPEEEQDQ